MKIYKYLSPELGNRFLDTLQIKFTPPVDLNDPFEYRPYVRNAEEGPLARLMGKSASTDVTLNDDGRGLMSSLLLNLSGRIGISCFSEDGNNLLLWSHYGAGHAGAAIGFDADHPFFASARLIPVTYADQRPTITSQELAATGFNYLRRPWPGWRYFLDQRPELIATKAACWAHEREIRVVKELPVDEDAPLNFTTGVRRGFPAGQLEDQLFDVPPAAVVSVTLGAKHQLTNSMEGYEFFSTSDWGLEDEIRHRIQRNPQLDHVQVLRAHADFRTYSMHTFDPLDFGAAQRFLHPAEIAMYRERLKGPHDASALQRISERLARRRPPSG
jgi:hypothetical protein